MNTSKIIVHRSQTLTRLLPTLLFLAIAFFALSKIALPGQSPAPETTKAANSNPQGAGIPDAGLLLGMYFSNAEGFQIDESTHWVPEVQPDPHGHYVTFWIARQRSQIKIRKVEDLIVPRATGFWHVGTHFVKPEGGDDEQNFEEKIWAAPIGQKPDLQLTDPELGQQGFAQGVRVITYAGPQYISYDEHWFSGVNSWEYTYPHVVSFDDLKTELPVSLLLGDPGGTVYARLAKSLNKMNAEPSEEEGGCACCEGDAKYWGLAHQHEGWVAFARFWAGTSSSCSQQEEDHEVKTPIPGKIVTTGVLQAPWNKFVSDASKLLGVQPQEIRHAFASPKQNLVILLTSDSLFVLSVESSRLKDTGVSVALGQTGFPVMEQWALGKFVANWDDTVSKEESHSTK